MFSRRYNFVIVPQHSSKIRRFGVSGRLLICLFVFLGGVIISAAGFGLHFFLEKKHLIQAQLLQDGAIAFQQERTALITRLSQLEETLKRTDRFISHLEAREQDKTQPETRQGPVDAKSFFTSEGLRLASLKNESHIWSPLSNGNDITSLTQHLNQLTESALQMENKLHESFLENPSREILFASLPTLWPARGWITSEFGDIRSWHEGSRWHHGVDIASPQGAPIIASGDGRVTYTGYRGGYGKTIIVDHGYGITTLYGHCSELFVSEGKKVKRGAVIGRVGNTGRSTGSHLHYEVRVDGVALDPSLYIVEKL